MYIITPRAASALCVCPSPRVHCCFKHICALPGRWRALDCSASCVAKAGHGGGNESNRFTNGSSAQHNSARDRGRRRRSV